MSSPINPIISGLMQGFGIASQMKQQKLNQDASDRAQRRDADEIQTRDLMTQMHLNSGGYHPSTPAQDAELATGFKPGVTTSTGPDETGQDTSTTSEPTKTKLQSAKFGGKTYVRDEDQEDTDALAKSVTSAKALGDVKGQAAVKQATDTLNATGVEITPEMAGKTGLRVGQRIPAEKVDDLGRLMESAKVKPVGPGKLSTDRKTGVQTMITEMSDGTTKETTLKSKGNVGGTAPTEYQADTMARRKQADADKATAIKAQDDAAQTEFNQHHEAIGQLQTEEQKLWEDNKGMVGYIRSGKDQNGKTLSKASTVALQNQMKANSVQIGKLHTEQTTHMKAKNALLLKVASHPPVSGYAPTPAAGGGTGTWDELKKTLIPQAPAAAAPVE